jgi:hypothetical protein
VTWFFSIKLKCKDLRIRQKVAFDIFSIAFSHNHHTAGITDEFVGPLDHAMLFTGLLDLDLAFTSEFKTLFCATIGFHLGHLALLSLRMG